MLPILLSALCCFPLIYISSHKQVVPTLSEILSYEKDQIHFKNVLHSAFVQYFSGR